MNQLLNFKFNSTFLVLQFAISVVLITSLSCEPSKIEDKEIISNDSQTEVSDLKKPISIDSDAVEILRQSLGLLSSLSSFSVKSQSTMEDIRNSGHRVDLEISASLIVQRPNKLWMERHGDLLNQFFLYNGSSLTLYNPVQNVYATEEAPGTIEEMFQFSYDEFGLSAPVSDLINVNAFDLLMKDVNHAEIIAEEMIYNVSCDHLLFSRPGVDFQIWIAKDGSLLPYKYVVIDTSTPQLLGYSTIIRDWNLEYTIDEDIFNFSAPEGTYKIEFLPLD